jgi:hypothetical protein
MSQPNFPPQIFVPYRTATVTVQDVQGGVPIGKPRQPAAWVALRMDFKRDLGNGWAEYRGVETGNLYHVQVSDVQPLETKGS